MNILMYRRMLREATKRRKNRDECALLFDYRRCSIDSKVKILALAKKEAPVWLWEKIVDEEDD
jgi:hypothetical protein